MKVVVIIILLAIIAAILFFKLPSMMSTDNYENQDIPVTWNLDWEGGPGYDQASILSEMGPYNPGGHEIRDRY